MKKIFRYLKVYCPFCEGETMIMNVGFSADGVINLELCCMECQKESEYSIAIEEAMAHAIVYDNPKLVLFGLVKTIQ